MSKIDEAVKVMEMVVDWLGPTPMREFQSKYGKHYAPDEWVIATLRDATAGLKAYAEMPPQKGYCVHCERSFDSLDEFKAHIPGCNAHPLHPMAVELADLRAKLAKASEPIRVNRGDLELVVNPANREVCDTLIGHWMEEVLRLRNKLAASEERGRELEKDKAALNEQCQKLEEVSLKQEYDLAYLREKAWGLFDAAREILSLTPAAGNLDLSTVRSHVESALAAFESEKSGGIPGQKLNVASTEGTASAALAAKVGELEKERKYDYGIASQAATWEKLADIFIKHRAFYGSERAASGEQCAINELNRLYALESDLASLREQQKVDRKRVARLGQIRAMFKVGTDCEDSIVVANVENAMRRSQCLSSIERHFFQHDDEKKPSWGATPEEYVKQFCALVAFESEKSGGIPDRQPKQAASNIASAEGTVGVPPTSPAAKEADTEVQVGQVWEPKHPDPGCDGYCEVIEKNESKEAPKTSWRMRRLCDGKRLYMHRPSEWAYRGIPAHPIHEGNPPTSPAVAWHGDQPPTGEPDYHAPPAPAAPTSTPTKRCPCCNDEGGWYVTREGKDVWVYCPCGVQYRTPAAPPPLTEKQVKILALEMFIDVSDHSENQPVHFAATAIELLSQLKNS